MTKLTPATDLSAAAAKYLNTPKDHVGPILGGLFSGDAVVHDEGRNYVGFEAIRSWCNEMATAFTFTRMITGTTLFDNSAIVQVELEGNFPGSPVELHHHLSLAGDKIAALTICP